MINYRKKCLAEKGERCHICSAADCFIVVHHIDRDRHNNSLDNLVPLCGPCHMKIHTDQPGYEEWVDELKPKQSVVYAESDTLVYHMTVSQELAERLVEQYPEAKNVPEALRSAGSDIVDA